MRFSAFRSTSVLLGALLMLNAGCQQPGKKKSGQSGSATSPGSKSTGPVQASLLAHLPLLKGGPVQPGPVLEVSAAEVRLNGSSLLSLQAGTIAAEHKKDGPDGFFVDPLYRTLVDLKKLRTKGKKPGCLLLAASETTPYHTVIALLYTAAQAGLDCYQIGVARPPESQAKLTAVAMSFASSARLLKGSTASLPQGYHAYRDGLGRKVWALAPSRCSALRSSAPGKIAFMGQRRKKKAAASSDAEDALGALLGHTVGDDKELGALGGNKPAKPAPGMAGSQGFGVGKYKSNNPRVFMSRASVSGGLDAATVRKVVRRHLSELKYCYVSIGLPANPKLDGMVKVSWTITSSGGVGRVAIAQSTLNHLPTESCIKKAVQRWRFPKPEGAMPFITYPFHFKPKG